jgi:uncharacterized membrane protein YhaH (DUF805 family)
MSWGDIFFGFGGRINRKIYWAGSLLVGVLGLLFAALLAYLATGNPLAPEVWERPADKSGLWGPVWLAYFGFLVWPSTALAVKRLHDRDRPAWIWYAYYSLSLALSLLPLRATSGAEPNAISGFLAIPLMVFAGYVFFELGVLRGTPGLNANGEDTLPAGYYGGDYNFWSWMFALEGRISRSKWWLGLFILVSVAITALFVAARFFNNFAAHHPEFQEHLDNPEWLTSKEAAPFVSALEPWMIGPGLILCLVLWSLLALGVKRLHDRGLSSWLILVVVLPFFGVLVAPAFSAQIGENALGLPLLLLVASVIWSVLQFGILKGDTGPNQHGPDPLAG